MNEWKLWGILAQLKNICLMASLDNWTAKEITDLEFIEDRIDTHLEDWNPKY